MRFKNLTQLIEDNTEAVALTAHRGASFEYPENTIMAMDKAVEAGADFIEFDLHPTADDVPVLLHDRTIDRTSDGSGTPENYQLAELKQFNFSYFHHEARHNTPYYDELKIPTFEEILQIFRGRAFMNIQIYLGNMKALETSCRLYRKYDMYDHGYMTIADIEILKQVKEIDPKIEICLTPGWHERALPQNLQLCKDYGCRFVQPTAESVSSDTFKLCRELGLRANIFYADFKEDFERLLSLGANGVMTNRIKDFKFFS